MLKGIPKPDDLPVRVQDDNSIPNDIDRKAARVTLSSGRKNLLNSSYDPDILIGADVETHRLMVKTAQAGRAYWRRAWKDVARAPVRYSHREQLLLDYSRVGFVDDIACQVDLGDQLPRVTRR